MKQKLNIQINKGFSCIITLDNPIGSDKLSDKLKELESIGKTRKMTLSHRKAIAKGISLAWKRRKN